MHKLVSVLLACSLVAGCTGAAAQETTTTSTTMGTTTATVEPTTTTTLPPVVEIDGSPGSPLTNFLTAYYGYATGRSEEAPDGVPSPMLPEPGSAADRGTVKGKVTVADVDGARLAVFKSDKDVIGLVRNADGWRMVAGRAPSIGVKPWYGEKPILVAVVGSDARPGEDVAATRADSIHILGIDGKGGAALVGIPRDSWVSIPGYGTSKINASLSAGGPDMMMATFEDLSGLDLTGYVLTGFEGFEHLVDDVLLPFDLDVPFTFSDRAAKADFVAGIQTVDGRAALSFARTRKAFTSGDFQRQLNGGLLLIAALGGAKIRGPLAFPEIIAGTQEWMLTDLSPGQLLAFALAADAVSLTEIDNMVLAGRNATTSGGAAIVRLDEAAAAAVFADLADGSLD
ncbi:MAG: LCP family protein [Acidimicrobiia bacterium]|nr:LCP family protein [Acidimicrobiia bacterium]